MLRASIRSIFCAPFSDPFLHGFGWSVGLLGNAWIEALLLSLIRMVSECQHIRYAVGPSGFAGWCMGIAEDRHRVMCSERMPCNRTREARCSPHFSQHPPRDAAHPGRVQSTHLTVLYCAGRQLLECCTTAKPATAPAPSAPRLQSQHRDARCVQACDWKREAAACWSRVAPAVLGSREQ